MPNKSLFSICTRAWVAVPSLAVIFCAGSVRAQSSSRSDNYSFVVASGFLCDASESSGCPAVAKSANGDSYEISGVGTFEAQNKSVKAAGTFNHKSTNGNVLETGVWTVLDLVSFESYGIAPAALQQKGPPLGRPQFGPKRLNLRPTLLPTGGLAIFHILLMPMSGATKTAVLQVNCALGDVPRDRTVEGIRLTVDGNGSEFSEEAGGRVMFLSVPSEVGTQSKLPESDPATGVAEPPPNP
jgi:hypothetical protein